MDMTRSLVLIGSILRSENNEGHQSNVNIRTEIVQPVQPVFVELKLLEAIGKR